MHWGRGKRVGFVTLPLIVSFFFCCFILIRLIFFSPFNSYRFTVIAVDPQVKSIDGKTYDVLFIGTGIVL